MPRMSQDAPTFSPLYRQIKALITQALEAGEWRPGQVIPSEQELAVRFGVSQGTVRKAIDEMAAENLLVRKQGKGTYVASHNDPRALFRFLRLVPLDGDLSHPTSVPLDCWRAKAGQEASRMLAIEPGAPIIIVRRLLQFALKPVVIDEIYLSGETFQGLTAEVLQSWNGSLYSLFETRFGLRMIRAQERIRAVAADRNASEALKVAEGTPLLSVERVTYTYGDKPVEWRRGLYSTAEHFYLNELN
ncbi:GntR family transcriptional regulator [Thauera terpenica 58Eu]|jgi:GntR family transcriptional regulator|uniref:GntR family transcriptional regulator n=2 Tax=Thauera terpenica TaxID=76113 RepID=S9ZQY5_9RHOO|nr:GntR family transcriptional regulator [Thauera terpenica 58Eu]